MTAAEWTFREPDLLAALEAVIGGPLPARHLTPGERRAHEAAFECEAPEPEPPDVAALEARYEDWLLDDFGGAA